MSKPFIEVLKKVSIFQGGDELFFEEVFNFGIPKNFCEGEIIFTKGDIIDNIYIVIEGCVKVSLSNENFNSETFRILSPGDFFGDINIIDDGPCDADLIAMSEGKALCIKKDNFEYLMDKYPQITREMLYVLCNRFRLAIKRISNRNRGRMFKTIQSLLDEAHCRGVNGEEGIILPELTHLEWACYSGLSRENFTKSISVLKKNGLLKTHSDNPRRLIVHDLDKLLEFQVQWTV